jgi:hypothetical protein
VLATKPVGSCEQLYVLLHDQGAIGHFSGKQKEKTISN